MSEITGPLSRVETQREMHQTMQQEIPEQSLWDREEYRRAHPRNRFSRGPLTQIKEAIQQFADDFGDECIVSPMSWGLMDSEDGRWLPFRKGRVCPLAAVLYYAQPPYDPHYTKAVAQVLDRPWDWVIAFTWGYDGLPCNNQSYLDRESRWRGWYAGRYIWQWQYDRQLGDCMARARSLNEDETKEGNEFYRTPGGTRSESLG